MKLSTLSILATQWGSAFLGHLREMRMTFHFLSLCSFVFKSLKSKFPRVAQMSLIGNPIWLNPSPQSHYTMFPSVNGHFFGFSHWNGFYLWNFFVHFITSGFQFYSCSLIQGGSISWQNFSSFMCPNFIMFILATDCHMLKFNNLDISPAPNTFITLTLNVDVIFALRVKHSATRQINP